MDRSERVVQLILQLRWPKGVPVEELDTAPGYVERVRSVVGELLGPALAAVRAAVPRQRAQKAPAKPAPRKDPGRYTQGELTRKVERLLRSGDFSMGEIVQHTGVKHPSNVYKVVVHDLGAREITGRAMGKRYTLVPEVKRLPPKGPPQERPSAPNVAAPERQAAPVPPTIRRQGSEVPA